jgi:hypothetical protein
MKRENYNKRNGVIKLIIQKSEEAFEFSDFVEGVINFKAEKCTKSKESKVLGQKKEEKEVLKPELPKLPLLGQYRG